MIDLLKFEADSRSIHVVYNSLSNKDPTINVNITRKRLCPSLGYLYPDCKPALLGANTLD